VFSHLPVMGAEGISLGNERWSVPGVDPTTDKALSFVFSAGGDWNATARDVEKGYGRRRISATNAAIVFAHPMIFIPSMILANARKPPEQIIPIPQPLFPNP